MDSMNALRRMIYLRIAIIDFKLKFYLKLSNSLPIFLHYNLLNLRLNDHLVPFNGFEQGNYREYVRE